MLSLGVVSVVLVVVVVSLGLVVVDFVVPFVVVSPPQPTNIVPNPNSKAKAIVFIFSTFQ